MKLSNEQELKLIDLVDTHKNNRGTDWNNIKVIMNNITKDNLSEEQWRSKYRNLTRSCITAIPTNEDEMVEEIKSRLLDNLTKNVSKPLDLNFLSDLWEVPLVLFDRPLQELIEYGYNIFRTGDSVILTKKPTMECLEIEHPYNNETTFKIGLVSDTHLCSLYEDLETLEDIYAKFNRAGVKNVYHAGDISEGWKKSRPSSIYAIKDGMVGVDQQAEYIARVYPEYANITTHFITGNHDGWHIENGGANIGKRIASLRDDMNYIGHNFAKVWLTPSIDMDLRHPMDGSSLAVSHKLQRCVDTFYYEDKPKLLAIGHYHKECSMFYKGVRGLIVPTVQKETDFTNGVNIGIARGAYIITIECDKQGNLKRIVSDFLNYNY